MKIGFDIDGVIVDTISNCAKGISKHLGYEVSCEDVVYRFEEMYEAHDFWSKNSRVFLCSIPPYDGVCEHINELIKSHEIYFISARGYEVLEDSKIWFEKHGLPTENIYFTSGETKTGICKELELDLFIEDSPKNAEEISLTGIPVLLMDTEYNRDYNGEKIVRCKDWDDLIEKISKFNKK